MTVDPVDGQTFWYTAEYGGDGDDNSLTRIFAFQLERKGNDLAVLEITLPETSSDLGATESVVVDIQNVGKLEAANFELMLSLNNNQVETFTYTETLEAGEIYTHTFANTIDLSAIGEYNIEVSLNYEVDESERNNSRSKVVSKLANLDAAISLSIADRTCSNSIPGTLKMTNEGADVLTSAQIEAYIAIIRHQCFKGSYNFC